MADKDTTRDGQEVRPTEQQTVFPKSASEEPGLPPNVVDPAAANTDMVYPRIDDPPGVTGIDRGSDPSVPSFIPDVVGPRVAGDDEGAASPEERAAETADPAKKVAGDKARAARAARAADKDKR